MSNDYEDVEYEEDEEESDLESDSESAEQEESLDDFIIALSDVLEKNNLDLKSIRAIFFDKIFKDVAESRGYSYESLLLESSKYDDAYNKVIVYLYPAISKYFNPSERTNLTNVLVECLFEALHKFDPTEQVNIPTEDSKSNEGIDIEVDAYVMKILSVYKDLFEVGFELKVPYGILTKEGVLRLKDGKVSLVKNNSFVNLFDIINQTYRGVITQSSSNLGVKVSELRDVILTRNILYYPEFQLGNLFGVLGNLEVKSWEELEQAIKPELHRNIRGNINKGNDVNRVINALNTCIIVSDFDVQSHLSLRFNVGGVDISSSDFKALYKQNKNSIFAGNGVLYHLNVLESGVLETAIVLNKDAYSSRPLFAYEAIASMQSRGKVPSIRNVVLGQDTSGKILTANLDTQQSSIILVGAGQRSGKGVLTLNVLGTILSNGSPLIYMDGKPDMSTVLIDVGSKNGIKPAVWDVFNSNGNEIGSGAPERIVTENPGIFGVLVYMKVLQLMMVAASLKKAKGFSFLDNKRPFFVFDEAYVVQMTLAANWNMILNISKDKSASNEERDWCLTIIKWFESLDANLAAVINSQLPESGISTIWLFQSMQPTSWNKYAVQGTGANKINVLKNPIESRLSLKFLGRGTSDSEYALGSAKVKEDNSIQTYVLSDTGRHFALTGSQKITSMASVKIFKPYLVLNSSANGSSSVEELKGVVSSSVLSIIAPDGHLDSRVGFDGFTTMLGDSAIKNLGLGRQYLEKLLEAVNLMPKYNSIEDYIYDASSDSFITLGKLVKMEDTPGSNNVGTSWAVNKDVSDKVNQDSEDNYSTNTDVPNVQDNPSSFEGVKKNGFDGSYNNEIVLERNPFIGTNTDKPLNFLNSVRSMSAIIIAEIEKMVGDLSRVESFEITTSALVINNIAFKPRFSSDVIDSMPFDIRNQVLSGNVVELFSFENIRKFKNLVVLRIDNPRLAEGRVRRELGLRQSPWSTLFRKFTYLKEIYISGDCITDDVSASNYDNNGRGGYDLTEKLRNAVKMPLSRISNSRMESVWNSRPVRVLGGAAGWTVGIKATLLATAIFGGWGILFGALASYGAIRGRKKK